MLMVKSQLTTHPIQEEAPKKNKYNASKSVFYIESERLEKIDAKQYKALKASKMEGYDFILFDSYHEGLYYLKKLLPLIKKGKITVQLQPKFTLLEAFTTSDGKKNQAITYIPDFKVTYDDGRQYVIDIKGMEDQKFPLKRKLFEHRYREYGSLKVMKHVEVYGGFITYEQYMEYRKEDAKEKTEAEKQGKKYKRRKRQAK